VAILASPRNQRGALRRRSQVALVERDDHRPDLHNSSRTPVEAGGANQGAGQMRLLDGTVPVYLCGLSDDSERLMAW